MKAQTRNRFFGDGGIARNNKLVNAVIYILSDNHPGFKTININTFNPHKILHSLKVLLQY